MIEGKIDTKVGNTTTYKENDINDKKVQLMRDFFQKTQNIQRHGLALTAELAKANIMAIMKLGNATAPIHVQSPEEEIRVMKELITNGSSNIIEAG